LRQAITRVVGKPGTLRFRLARDTSTLGRWAKELGHLGWRGEPSCGSVTVRRTYGRGKSLRPLMAAVIGTGYVGLTTAVWSGLHGLPEHLRGREPRGDPWKRFDSTGERIANAELYLRT